MNRHLRAALTLALLVPTALAALAAPAGAQQVIDATEQGGEAFIAFTAMVVLFTATLFMMDRIRRRRTDED